MLHAIIMAGGGGTRFWPRSRRAKPKQFLRLVGEGSLLEQTAQRLRAKVSEDHLWVMTAGQHRQPVMELLPGLHEKHIVGEPMGRDTAACIGLGAALIYRDDPSATMIVVPADHVIEPSEAFARAVEIATNLVEKLPMALVTFGIRPTNAATGYGYIQRGPLLVNNDGIDVYRVAGFREKPKQSTAEEYVSSGEYFWNSGIFVWKAKTILDELAKHQPSLLAAVERIARAWGSPQQEEVFRAEYQALNKISIDYAVMEHAQEVLVVEAPFSWDDVGSWLALERLHAKDAHGNTIMAKHSGVQTSNCVIYGNPNVLITTIGVHDLLIIQDGDAIMVADKRDEGAIKQLVEQLEKQGLERYL